MGHRKTRLEIVSLGRAALAVTACAALAGGLVAASPQLAAASAGQAGRMAGTARAGTMVSAGQAGAAGTGRTAGAARPPLGQAQQRELLRLYAAYRHIPAGDIASINPASVRLARGARGGAEWASAGFLPSARAPLAIRVGFQDGGGSGIFTRAPGGAWKVAGLAGEPFGCGMALPASVRHAWRLARCPATTARPRNVTPSYQTGTTGDLAAIALGNIGVSDNPPEQNFNGLDCDPYTTLVDAGASSQGCGKTSNSPYFGSTQDESEFWCSDFTKWVWEKAGVTSDLSTLTASSATFYTWGQEHGESMPNDPTDPQVGDAVLFYERGTSPGSYSYHVGIITGVDPDGNVNMVNGDFLGSTNISVQYDSDEDLSSWAQEQGWGTNTDWTFVSPQLPTYNEADSPSGPVVWDEANGHLEVYGRDASPQANALGEDYWKSQSQGWSGWGVPQGSATIASTPDAIYDPASGNLEVYATGTDGDLQESWWNPGTGVWSHGSQAGQITGSPSAVYDPASGNLEVYAIGAGSNYAGQLVEDYWRPGGAGWTGWRPLGGDLTASPCAVYDPLSNHLEVYARSTSGTLWEAWWIPGGSGWHTGSMTIGGPISGTPSAVYDPAGGNLEVYATAAVTNAGQVEEFYWNASKNWRYGYLGGDVNDSPTAVYDTFANHLEVYAQAHTSSGSGGGLVEDYWRPGGAGWSGWGSSLGGSLASSPYALDNPTSGHLEIYALATGSPGTIWEAWWNPATGAWSTGTLGGALTGL